MATIKTAVSIQESLFEQINDLAEQLQVSRSQLFAQAIEEFIKRYQDQKMLDALNEVYSDVPDRGEEALRQGMRQQHRQLLEGQW